MFIVSFLSPITFLKLSTLIFLIKYFPKLIKKFIRKNRLLYWILFPPDNFFKFEYGNEAEFQAWEFVINKLKNYSSICELGCFNGRIAFKLGKSLQNKRYVGIDINFIAILIAKIFNIFKGYQNFSFDCKKGVMVSNKNCELFVSVATVIYFSEIELTSFIKAIKFNKSFKALILHEIFLNESFHNSKKTFIDDNLNIHSISMIKEKFGSNYDVEVIRTFYANWEKEDRISAILYIKKR